jgi:CRISPR system Cascade subunit CasB
MTDTMSYTEHVASVVDSKIANLQRGYLADRSAAVAALARLRRGVGKPAGSVLDILEFTYAPEFVADPRDDAPTAAEVAAHLCLTLYAVHQQSQRQPMHRRGSEHRLGRSIRALIPETITNYVEHSVARRFAILGTADSLDELTHHVRGMVQLLRAHDIPLDYQQLATDLLRWQRPDGPARVRLGWGRDFHRTRTTNPSTTTSTSSSADSSVDSNAASSSVDA